MGNRDLGPLGGLTMRLPLNLCVVCAVAIAGCGGETDESKAPNVLDAAAPFCNAESPARACRDPVCRPRVVTTCWTKSLAGSSCGCLPADQILFCGEGLPPCPTGMRCTRFQTTDCLLDAGEEPEKLCWNPVVENICWPDPG
jgi:hypothetical protein